MFPVPSHNLRHHEHEQCTFDFCEHSRVDFTSVEQRHEKQYCKMQRNEDCGRHEFLLGHKLWEEKAAIWKLYDQSLLDASHPYMAISHVWADGTGAGTWGSGKVNECLWEFFCDIARGFQCEGCWWDTISIPSDDEARAKALNNMHNNYTDARITLVHDLYLREWEWVDAETACFAIVMSPWYSRGWTALELAKSHKVKILFKARNDRYVIKDLDVDILAEISSSSRHYATAKSIRKLRNASIQSLGDLLSILGPRDTSKPRDVPIISGLLAGVHVYGGLSQQEIYQRVLRKLGKVAQGHLFHNSATMSSPGFSWCPTNILDMPLAESDGEVLELRENGDLEGVWKVYATDSVEPDDFIWKDTHPLTKVSLQSALEGRSKDNHVLLVENGDPRSRALLVRLMLDEKNTACCHFVGPVYFRSALGGDNDKIVYLETKLKIGSTEKMQELTGRAWDHLLPTDVANEATNRASPTEDTGSADHEALDAETEINSGPVLIPTDFKDWKAIFYSDKAPDESLFHEHNKIQTSKESVSKLPETMVLYYNCGHENSDSSKSSQSFFYGHKNIIRNVKQWFDQDQTFNPGKLMLLGLDDDNNVKVNQDDMQVAIHLAAEKACLDDRVAALLVEKTDNVDIEERLMGQTALHLAAKSGNYTLDHTAILTVLLEHAKNTDDHSDNTFDNDHSGQSNESLEEKIDENSDGDNDGGNNEASDEESDRDSDVSHGESEWERDKKTALHIAANKGYVSIVSVLLQYGADGDARDGFGRTALMLAAEGGRAQIVEILLNKRDPKSLKQKEHEGTEKDPDKMKELDDALLLAAEGKHAEAIFTLLRGGAKSGLRNSEGKTALHLAIEADDEESTKSLND
ncbi:hypothetical protein VMCG_07627 [Cytospora schulzeri]|uniref:Uncharacterized protein n=1 Tax=Cytospora schulzeri TaxID=448051 RepID=A0A423VXB8_9PEZI|nr:hypothetical protein VMCG_07627 [Valsa malicola]